MWDWQYSIDIPGMKLNVDNILQNTASPTSHYYGFEQFYVLVPFFQLIFQFVPYTSVII
jgi:hypothetical protein